METPQLYWLAIAVVCIGLTVLGLFMREGIITSNVYAQAVKLYQAHDYAAAETAFRNVLSRHPSNDIARLLLGETLMQQEKLEEAIAQLQELSSRAPKNADASLRLGLVLIKQDRLEEAIATLTTAKDLFAAQGNTDQANSVEQLLQQISTQQSITLE